MASPANMSTTDRVIRTILGLIVIWVVFYVDLAVLWQWSLTIIGMIMIITGLSGYCPIYAIIGIRTSRR